jgi:predicted CopG family antitoxin
MSHIIKVEDSVYVDLEHLRLGRQTFSDEIKILLDNRLKVLELFSVLEGQLQYREWQADRLRKIAKTV